MIPHRQPRPPNFVGSSWYEYHAMMCNRKSFLKNDLEKSIGIGIGIGNEIEAVQVMAFVR
jgi:hypothetical protein